MTDLEVFHATLAGERPGRVLYTADFTPDLHKRLVEHVGTEDLAGHYGFFSPVHVGMKPPKGFRKPDFSVYYAGEHLPEGTELSWEGVAMVPAGFYHFWGYHSPLRNATSLKQLESYPFVEQLDWLTGHMAGEVQAAHAAGKVVQAWIGHMYESAWQIRGYEQFLMDLAERPAWAECLLDKLFRRNMTAATAA